MGPLVSATLVHHCQTPAVRRAALATPPVYSAAHVPVSGWYHLSWLLPLTIVLNHETCYSCINECIYMYICISNFKTTQTLIKLAQLVKNPPAMPGFDAWVGKIPWRREWLPTPVFWPGEFHVLYSPWDCKESDMTEWLSQHTAISRSFKSVQYVPFLVLFMAAYRFKVKSDIIFL